MVLSSVTASDLPSSWQALKDRLLETGASTYIFFTVDNDPQTGVPWCPDVRAALPVVEQYFKENKDLDVAFVSVGSKPFWKDPQNVWRTKWELKAVPTLVKYTRVEDGSIVQTQLVEEDARDLKKLRAFTHCPEA